jgi:SNF2 family DNA or RNA helicase
MNCAASFRKLDYGSEKNIKDRDLTKLPEKMQKDLYEFQKKGILYGVERFGRLLLGDEMGVGKTIQAIGIMYIFKMDWPLMILCPSSLKYTWRDEFL